MSKFTDELEWWVQKRDRLKKKRRQDAAAVEFLTVKKDVTEAMEAGYSLKTIWEYLTEGKKIRSTYETFRRHVNRFIKATQKEQLILAAKIEAESNKSQTSKKIAEENKEAESKEPQLPGTSGFKFDAKPNKEELI